jgi:glucose-1-phosphate adenylyltransferase
VKDSVVLPNVDIGRRARITRAIIDKGARIPADMVIGEDPKADREKFYISPGGVVLVTAEALGQRLHYTR